MEERYRKLNKYLKDRFGERVLKICIDGGFTCPNRDGSKGNAGCIFCGDRGSGERLSVCLDYRKSIPMQIDSFLNSYRGQRANKFIVYFQNFSNTYDDISILREKYNLALTTSEKIIGLQVATRPDCINDDVARILSEYSSKYYVCVELGLQTGSNVVGKVINRGYSTEDFINACNILKKYNIDVVAHLMVGLPEDNLSNVLDTVKIINNSGCSGIKIHSTYVISGTKLCDMYESGCYNTISLEFYVDAVALIVRNLRRDIVIHRINADPPKELFVAPEWMLRKKIVLNAISKKLDLENIYQGQDYQ